MSDKVAVCITTYNEANTIGALLRRVQGLGYTVIVSDGGSTDRTPQIAAEAGATVLGAPKRTPIAIS